MALAALLGLAAPAAGCGGYDCEDLRCAELTGDASSSRTVTICRKPQGDCDGCLGRKIVDDDGKTVDACVDSEPGNCEHFMLESAAHVCVLGHTCTPNGDACGPSGSASAECCSGFCAGEGVCEAR